MTAYLEVVLALYNIQVSLTPSNSEILKHRVDEYVELETTKKLPSSEAFHGVVKATSLQPVLYHSMDKGDFNHINQGFL